MKDENGALQVGATYTISDTELAIARNVRELKSYSLAKLGQLLGSEIVKHFPPAEERRVEIDGKILMSRLIVMTPREYNKLADEAWKYRELQK